MSINSMRPSSGKTIKSAGNNVIHPTKQKPTTTKPMNRRANKIVSTAPKNVVLMRDINSTPGNGLWCQQVSKQDKPYQSIIPSLNTAALDIDPEKEADKKLISQLKYQVKDLTSQLQNQMAKCYDAEYRATRAENNQQTYIDMCESKAKEVKEYESKTESLEGTISSMSEALSNAKKEIVRLTNELKLETEKNKSLSQKLESLMVDNERNNYQNSTEVNSLNQKIQVITAERDNLIRIIQSKNTKENDIEEKNNLQKILADKEKILNSMEITMNKALNENAELKKRIGTEEINKSKLNEIIKKKKEKIKTLKEQVNGYVEYMNSYGNEVKWNQNQISQKDSQIKVMKDKIKQKDDLIVKLNKKIETLNKQIQKEKEKPPVEDNKPVEELVQVKAKPFLFGPENEEDIMFDMNDMN